MAKSILIALTAALALTSSLSAADNCIARPGEANYWGSPGNGITYGDPVPAGQKWIIYAAGITSQANATAEYMLMIAHNVASAGGQCCWFIAVQRSVGKPDGTPTIALDHDVTVLAGDRFAARVNGLQGDQAIAVNYLYWELPASCVAPTGYSLSYVQTSGGKVLPADMERRPQ